MTALDDIVAKFRAGSPNIAAAFDEVQRRLTVLEGGTTPPPPPPTGTLRWKPPGYPNYTGYTTLVANAGTQQLNLDNTKDYVVDVSTKTWSSLGSGRSIGLPINGGRNVVVIGGAFLFNSTNNMDDATAVLVDGGEPSGIVHLEGINIDCANGITIRTKRVVQIENCRIRVRTWNDDSSGGSGIHPDIVQVWGTDANTTPCAGIRMHKVTGFTRYTGLVCLVERPPGGNQVDPVRWDRYEVSIGPDANNNGTRDAGNYAYMCSGPTGQANGPFTEYHGEVYADLPTGGGGAYTRPIDGIVILKYIGSGGAVYFPYEIHKPDGTVVYTSPTAPTGGNGPLAETQKAGNYLTFSRVPKFADHKWIIGKPSAEFCPANVPGVNYVSPGYL